MLLLFLLFSFHKCTLLLYLATCINTLPFSGSRVGDTVPRCARPPGRHSSLSLMSNRRKSSATAEANSREARIRAAEREAARLVAEVEASQRAQREELARRAEARRREHKEAKVSWFGGRTKRLQEEL